MAANSELLGFFFEVLNTVKLYHWKTKSYAEHKATDELHANLSENIDKYVEVLLGKQIPVRIDYKKTAVTVHDFDKREAFINKLKAYCNVLQGFNKHLDAKRDSDLLNIRDEMLGDINQTLYLFSLH
jgi:hypothetical protein